MRIEISDQWCTRTDAGELRWSDVKVPTFAPPPRVLDTDDPADMATVDALNGYTDMFCLFLEECEDAAAWRHAFARFVSGMHEADRYRELLRMLDGPAPEEEVDNLITNEGFPPSARPVLLDQMRSARAVTMSPRPPVLSDEGDACRSVTAFLRALDGAS